MARRIGRMKKLVDFYRLVQSDDGFGNTTDGFDSTPFIENISGEWFPQRGVEAFEAGRLESEVTGTITVRASNATRGVTAADKLNFDGNDYQIRAITSADLMSRFLEIRVQRGVAM